MRSHQKFLFASFFVLCVFASAARADTIVITGGNVVQVPLGSHTYDLQGNGFRASGRGNFGRTPCVPCQPGTIHDFFTEFSGEDSLQGGPATYNGTDYALLFYGGRITLTIGDINLPADGQTGLVTLNLPFTLSGNLRAFQNNPFVGPPGPAVFDVTLTGQGTAVFEFISTFDPVFGQLYTIRSMTYNFEPAPVPEPATFALLATGLFGAAAAARRRRRPSQP
jgi:PEP-CTERM motif